MPIVEVNGQELEFPDTMGKDEIKAVLQRKFPPETAQKPPQVTKGQSAIAGMTDMASFGLDPILRGAGATIGQEIKSGFSLPFSDTYAKNRDAIENAYKLARDENPKSYIAGQVAGGVLPAVAAPETLLGNWSGTGGLGARMLKTGLSAAPSAGFYGFNKEHGDFEDKAKSAASYAIPAGLVGALLPLAGAVTKSGYNSLKSFYEDRGLNTAEKFLKSQLLQRPDLEKILARAEKSDAISKNTGIPLTLAEKVAQSPTDPLLLQQKNLATNPATAGVMEDLYAARSGTPTTQGQIEKALMNKVSQLSPETQNYDDLAQILIQKGKEGARNVTKKLTDKASPLYEEAFSKNQNVSSPLLDKLLETPAGKEALSNARQTFLNNRSLMGINDPDLFEQAALTGAEIPKGGVSSGLKLETYDEIKKGLDTAIENARANLKPGQPDTAHIKSLMSVRSQLVSELDRIDVTKNIPAGRDPVTNMFTPATIHPEGGAYARARAIYSGNPDMLQMRQQIGQLADVDPMKADKVADVLFKGTPANAQRTAQALGDDAPKAAAARILDVLGQSRGMPTTYAEKIAPNVDTTEMLRAYAGNSLDDTLEAIRKAALGERVRFGSPTQPLQNSALGLDKAANDIINLATGDKIGLLQKMISKFGQESDPQFYKDMSDLMTTDKGMDLLRKVAEGKKINNSEQKLLPSSIAEKLKSGLIRSTPSTLNDFYK